MGLFNRQSCLALLSLLLLAHAALTLHVASHVPADPAKCEYCGGNANPAQALLPATLELPLFAAEFTEFAGTRLAPHTAAPFHYRERAPPLAV